MTSCANIDQGWILEAKEIILNSETNRGLAQNIKIKASGNTIFALPLLPFTSSDNNIDLGNSGTCMRLMMVLIGSLGIDATLVGDESLSKRPI